LLLLFFPSQTAANLVGVSMVV